MKGEGLSCLQVVVGGVQSHLSFVGGAYLSFYFAKDGEKEKKKNLFKKKSKHFEGRLYFMFQF